MGYLSGKTALVTGASAGIGEQTARALIDAGARVVCGARRVERLQSLTDGLGERSLPLELDVVDPRSVDTMIDRLPKNWREVDILVNHAGHDIGGRRQFH